MLIIHLPLNKSCFDKFISYHHKLFPTEGQTHGAGCVRQWFRTAEPLGERRYENWNTHTYSLQLYSCCQNQANVVIYLFFHYVQV